MAEEPRDAADLGLEAPPRRPSRAGRWIALGCGVSLLVSFACCGGAFLLLRFTFDQVEASLLAQLRENELLTERIGELREVELDWKRSFAEPSMDVDVYDVVGSSGSGRVRVESETLDEGGERILWAELELPSGERVDLYPFELIPPAGDPGPGHNGREAADDDP